jgi:hypothetical protein
MKQIGGRLWQKYESKVTQGPEPRVSRSSENANRGRRMWEDWKDSIDLSLRPTASHLYLQTNL